jgi:glycosyltransferase involved in cell wall biosynthesis
MTNPKPRLWVVSELYYPEQTSTGYFLTAIAEGLTDDFDVRVICGKPSYSERGQAVVRREVRNDVVIHRMRATHFDKDNLFLRAVNSVTLGITATIFAALNFRRVDSMLIVTNPPTLPPILGLIARMKNMRSHLLVHDVYPEVLAVTGMVDPGGTSWRVLSNFFNRTLASFDNIVVLGRDMKSTVAGKLTGRRHPPAIEIIENWGDVGEIKPVPRGENAFAIEHGLTDKTVIQFSGNIGRTHDIGLLLEVARRVEHIESIVFLFVGYGGRAKEVADHERPNVLYLPRQPRDKLNSMLACSDVTVIAFKASMKGVSVPSRMYNVMAAGVPIAAIAEADAELTRTVTENRAGWHLTPNDADGLERLVRHLDTTEGQNEARRVGANARSAVEQRYTLERVIDKYRALLR